MQITPIRPAKDFFEEITTFDEFVQKIREIWANIYDVVVLGPVKIFYILRDKIRSSIGNAIFFPLKCPSLSKEVKDRWGIEENYVHQYWDPSKPHDPNLKNQQKIREVFGPPADCILQIEMEDGRPMFLHYQVIETKEGEGDFYNFVLLPEVLSTVDSNVGAIHPYLAAYVNAKETLPPARFIVVSENNLNFKPSCLNEAGYVLLETLKGLKKEFGDIDQLIAQSLSNVFLANALKQTKDLKILPKHICIDRAPSSTKQIFREFYGKIGFLSELFSKFGGWSLDLEQEIVDFMEKWGGGPEFVISGALRDTHFSNQSNLCLKDKIKRMKEVDLLVFDPPDQIVSKEAHHDLRVDFFNSLYLAKPSSFMRTAENLAEALLRNSMEDHDISNLK